MPHYTLYFFDEAQRPSGFVEFDESDDAAAIAAMGARRCGRAAELWRGDQRILWWPPDREAH
ncbi:MAG TPA: hypothetical protein VK801_09785 [Caulobacteraceae bacterium]|nr:hypothetical protein [Caulobacteraceae bacterium]